MAITLTSVGDTATVNAINSGAVGISVSSGTNVVMIVEGTADGISWATLSAIPSGLGAAVTTITTTGLWWVQSAGLSAVRLRVTSVGATPSATVTLTPSQATGSSIPPGAFSPFGTMLISPDPTTQFTDTFDGAVVNTTDVWTTQLGAGAAITQGSGSLSIISGTTTLSYAAIYSKANLPAPSSALQSVGFTMQVETPIKANVKRFWGIGTVPGTPTIATPITDGIGFELDEGGVLRAVVYAAGVRSSQSTVLTNYLSDGLQHTAYFSYISGAIYFFQVENGNAPVAQIFNANPSQNSLPVAMVAVNAATPPTAGQANNINFAAASDYGKNANQISDGTYPQRRATVAADGSIQTIGAFANKRTYSASANVATAAAATDIALIPGNATTTVYVTKVIISGIQTTGGLADIQLIKRSTANSGGTSGAMSVVPHDANDAAANSTPISYTANPTPGTAVGSVRRSYAPIGAATSIVNPVVVFDFGVTGKPIILRGVAQGLAVNLGGATLAGGTFDIDIEWQEV